MIFNGVQLLIFIQEKIKKMKYELKSVKTIGSPYNHRDIKNSQAVEIYGINILIITTIVGQTYNGFCNYDTAFFELDKTKTIEENQTAINDFAVQYIKNKYPNT